MIVDKYIKIRTNSSNMKHYRDKGYLINKANEFIEVLVDDLPSSSHVKIMCQCSKCIKIKEVTYHNYKRQTKDSYYVCFDCQFYKSEESFISKYGVKHAMDLPGMQNKVEETNIKKYGVKSPLCLKEVRDKAFEGCDNITNISQLEHIKEIKRLKSMKKYGTNTPLQDETIINIIRQKLIESGRYHQYDVNKYSDYRRIVDNLTKRNKKKLLEDWDGYDYYDKSYIKDNYILESNDSNYPSIDHKTSVMYGFINNIDPEIIGSIENLCITKRFINSMKFVMNEDEFVSLNIDKSTDSKNIISLR